MSPYVCVASQSKGPEKEFGGAAFVAQTEEDFQKATRLENAECKDLSKAPGGGKMVTIPTPSGSCIHVVFGQQERPLPEKPVSATEIHKGEYNTSIEKLRKGITNKTLCAQRDTDVLWYRRIPTIQAWPRHGPQAGSLRFYHQEVGRRCCFLHGKF